jgi:hypothetical protein
MSGIVGHTLFGVLGLKAVVARKLPLAGIAARHQASYLAGAYLGSDIQTMPEAVCIESGREVGYGTAPLERSPITGGPVRPWSLAVGGRSYRPREIHELFYGRSHVVFGWPRQQRELAIPWDHLPDYFAAVVEDTYELFGPGKRPLAYVLGWMAHVVSDSLIKSVQPGIDLNLLDGKYTPRNRPIQDLFMYHEIGLKELHLDWPALFIDLVETPIEPVQFHYMRIAQPRGQLAQYFPHEWRVDQKDLLRAVFAENRRWCRFHAQDVLRDMQLLPKADGTLDCNDTIRQQTGLSYAQMIELAQQAKLRRACWQMGEAIADMFTAVAARSPRLSAERSDESSSWEEITKAWQR